MNNNIPETSSVSVLNTTQKTLALEFAEDRIVPCILNLLECSKDIVTQKSIMEIILLSRNITHKKDSDSFLNKLNLNKPVTDLLKSLFALYQENNETHIFIQSLLDQRFYNSKIEFKVLKKDSKKELLSIYNNQIDKALDTHYSKFFKEISNTSNPTTNPMVIESHVNKNYRP